MQLGMIGLGRMGSNMVRRLLEREHDCVVYDLSPEAVAETVSHGARGADSIEGLVSELRAPRAVWLMIPAGTVDKTIARLRRALEPGDIVIDGGNSHYVDDVRRAGELRDSGIRYVDVGTSGGVWGLENGFCQMIGGEDEVVTRLDPIFASLAPGLDSAARDLPENSSLGTARRGYLHCGPAGAGHFVKMVHNGIEYGLMAAYAEGLDVLRHADAGLADTQTDAETAPLARPELYGYELDLGAVAEVWRHGSVIRSWLLDLIAPVLAQDSDLGEFTGEVADSGEGRWTIQAAIDEGVPVPVMASALFARFSSRGRGEFANRVLSAMRREFGGHRERHSGGGKR
jgi:6-phosphogluconate dehydrogenase